MINPLFLIDFYKVGHINQYPAGISQVWSNWTPRTSRVDDTGQLRLFLNSRKGGDMSEWPDDLRVRQFPEVTASEWLTFTKLADKACRASLKETEGYKVFRKAQAIAQQRRSSLFLINHRRRMEKDVKERVA